MFEALPMDNLFIEPFVRHAGLDPASRDPMKGLDSGFRRNDTLLLVTKVWNRMSTQLWTD